MQLHVVCMKEKAIENIQTLLQDIHDRLFIGKDGQKAFVARIAQTENDVEQLSKTVGSVITAAQLTIGAILLTIVGAVITHVLKVPFVAG